MLKEAKQTSGSSYDDGFLRVEYENFYAECDGEYLNLVRTEFLILAKLTLQPGRYSSAKSIWEYVWEDARPLNVDSLKVFIFRLRRKLEPFEIKIETLVNVGYRLVAKPSERN